MSARRPASSDAIRRAQTIALSRRLRAARDAERGELFDAGDDETMTDEALIETLAALEHDRWSGWMTYLFTKGYSRDDGAFVIDPESVHWWTHMIDTPYADLTEKSKESDRVEARKTLALLAECGR